MILMVRFSPIETKHSYRLVNKTVQELLGVEGYISDINVEKNGFILIQTVKKL